MSTAEIPANIASAPVSQAAEANLHAHAVQFYTEDSYLLDNVSKFIGDALKAGDATVAICTKPHRAGIVQRMSAHGIDLAHASQSGRYVVLDAAETLAKFMGPELPDGEKFNKVIGNVLTSARMAAFGGSSKVYAFGEMVALLWSSRRPQAAIQLEQLWNELAERHEFSLLCAYPLAGFDRDEHEKDFLDICAAHNHVVPSESYSSLETEEERNRSIIQLQQKAVVLETEKAERREIEKKLRIRESELADVLENALEGVQLVGPDQCIHWANRAALKLLGYSRDEYVGHPVSEFYVESKVFEEYWERLMQRENIYDFPAELRCKDGSVKNVLMHSNGLWEEGKFVHTRCFLRDVTEQKRMEQILLESKAELELQVEQRTLALRQLSSQVLAVQESERRRVARELHDSLGQYLVGLKLNVDMLRQSPGRAELWAQSERLLERCVSEVRTLSHLLHPPMMEEAGFIPAARWYVEGFGKRSGLKIFWVGPWNDGSWRFPAAIELALFRTLQESVTNVHRHSRASAVTLRLGKETGNVTLEIEDNGCGITPELLTRFNQSGLGMGIGLTGMRERVRELNGKLELQSRPHGTLVRVAIPIPTDVAIPEMQHSPAYRLV